MTDRQIKGIMFGQTVVYYFRSRVESTVSGSGVAAASEQTADLTEPPTHHHNEEIGSSSTPTNKTSTQ